MSDVQIISGAKEQQLLEAMESAISKSNDGLDPNEAIAKTANEQGLSPEFACRMVEAFNTSKTIKHLKDNEGEKRADTFGIASKDEVVKLMYDPKEEKVATELRGDSIFNFNKAAESKVEESLEKVAGSCGKKKKKKARPMAKTTVKQARAQLSEIRWARRELEASVNHAKQAALASMDRLGDSFRMTEARPFHEVEEVVRYNLGDELGKQAMELVWKRGPRLDRMGEKRAEAAPETPKLFGKTASDAAASEMVSLLKKASDAEIELAEFEKVAAPVEKYIATLLNSRFKKEAADGDEAKETKSLLSNLTGGQVPFYPKWFPEMIDKEPPALEPIMDPKQEAELRKVKMKLMVNDMISNDPVLSAYAPDEVIGATNELGEIAPTLATNKPMMRSTVARYLQQGGRLGPEEVKQIMDMENTARKTGIGGE